MRWQWLERGNILRERLRLHHAESMVSPMRPWHQHQPSASKYVSAPAARHDYVVRFASSSFDHRRREPTDWLVPCFAFKPWIVELEPSGSVHFPQWGKGPDEG
jgi:hypothetical protein